MIRALLWDVDGTIAETERDGHRVAFNRAFEGEGLPWQWDEARYGELLRITGGRERLMHDMATRADAPATAQERAELAKRVHVRKNAHYAELVQGGGIELRSGVKALMDEARAQGVRMGIATTTSRANVEALMQRHLGAAWASWFAVVVCGEDVQHKKPDPEVYAIALDVLGLRPPEAVAIEDSPGGVAAACAAQVPVIVTRSAYFANDTVEGVIAVGPGLDRRDGWTPAVDTDGQVGGASRITLADLTRWHERMELVSQFGD
jgi:HAD superfamily hydrolase (TIGR01509 family)